MDDIFSKINQIDNKDEEIGDVNVPLKSKQLLEIFRKGGRAVIS